MAEPQVQEQNDAGAWVDIPTPTPSPAPPVADPGDDAPPPAAAVAVPATPVAEEKKPKPREDAQARFDELTRYRREAERRAEAAEAKLRELEARTAPNQPAKEAPKPAVDAEPDPTNLQAYPEGQYDRKFLKDQARWEARQELQQVQRAQRDQAAAEHREQRFRTRAAAIKTKLDVARSDDPEFLTKLDQRLITTLPASVLAPNEPVTFDNFLVEQILDVDHPRDVLLHLSQPDVYQRLATLPPSQVIRELVRFEASLGAAATTGPAREEKPKSKATAPISPVTGSSQVSASEEPGDNASDDEWFRWQKAHGKLRKRA